MIQGIGVDVVDMHRMKAILSDQSTAFIDRVFTETEIAYCQSKQNPEQHFAARFAAKEAVSKAMQTGWSGIFRWKDVEVVNEPSGAPKVLLYNAVARSLEKSVIHLSLSHTENTVVALAVIEASSPGTTT
jgi:holo-[acyl-carrier protein] synthase